MDFSLAITIDPPTATFAAHGELDIFTARQLSRQLADVITAGCRRVMVDVSAVTFVDASALGVLVRARDDLRAHDGELGFLAASPPFRRLCRLTGLDQEFDLN